MYLKKNGIFHRDIKPQNILIDKKTNIIKLTDYGVSKIVNQFGNMSLFAL